MSEDLQNKGLPNREKTPRFSKVKYDIYYSPHGNPNDFKDLFGRIKTADIYVPEVYGWSREYLDLYQDVSAGRKTPEQAIREKKDEFLLINPLLVQELQALYQTNKPVVFIDLPEEETPHSMNRIRLAAQSFDGLLDNVQYYLEEEGKLNIRREEHMVEQLRTQVGEVLDTYPELKTKSDVGALVSLGSVHTGVYHQLREEGERVERAFNVMPQVYSLKDEGIRRYMSGNPVDKELAAQILLETVFENVFQSELEKVTTDNDKLELFKRKVASQFNLEEIRDIMHLLTYTDWNYFRGSFESYMIYKMEEQGMKIPASLQEFESILG